MKENVRRIFKTTKRIFTWLGYAAIILAFWQYYEGKQKDIEISSLGENVKQLNNDNKMLISQLYSQESMLKDSIKERQDILKTLKQIEKNNISKSAFEEKILDLINKSEETIEKDISDLKKLKEKEVIAYPSTKWLITE